jgi:hypothetical protein
MSAPKLKGWVHSALEILPEPARLKAYEMEVHAKELEALEKMELMCKCWCEDDCSDYTRTLEILPHNNEPLYASPVLLVGRFQSKIKQLRGQGTPINSKLIDEIGIFINHVGLNKGTLLQLAKRLGLDVEKHFKQSKPAECNEDDDTEVATLHQVKELLAIAGTTGLCIEEIIACVRGLQESSCRVDFLEIPDCDMDVLHEFEELIVGMKACQLENRSHSLSEPCDILIAEEGVQNSCEDIWNDAEHCGMDALHEIEELIVGMKACQLENRSHSLSEPCDILIAEEGVQNSCEDIWNDAEHCGMDALHEIEELIVGMKACQLENRSHSLSEPCDILIVEESVQNSCEETWNDAEHWDMHALHEIEELIVGMRACQLECRSPSSSGPCDASGVEEILQNSCEEIWNDAEDIRKDYLGDTGREDHC